MHVIITGGTGMIGRALAADLARDGHRVTVLSRGAGRGSGLPAAVQVADWDGRTAAGWGSLADGAEAIVNLAGENLAAGRWTTARKRRIRDSRLLPGRAVVEAVQAAARRPRVVVQSSAVGFYGPRGDEIVTEDSAAGDDFLTRLCEDWENATAPVEALGVRRAVIRSGVVFGPDGGALPRMLLPFKLGVGGRLGGGRQWLSWIHLADELAAIRFLIDHEQATGAFNLTAPSPLTNADFARVAGRVLGRPAFMPMPAIALRLLFGEMATVLLDGQRVLPERLQRAGFAFRFPEPEAALRAAVGRPAVVAVESLSDS